MSNQISRCVADRIRELYLSGVSIRQCAKVAKVGRNTVRLLLRTEGLGRPNPISAAPKVNKEGFAPSLDGNPVHLTSLDFKVLESLFNKSRQPGESLDFKTHIMSLTQEIAKEIGISSSTDQMRLQIAIEQYILYRRFFVSSLTASDKSYVGPFSKAHDRLARAVVGWTQSSHKALEMSQRIIRELEIKHKKAFPDLGNGNVFINQSEFQLNQVNQSDVDKANPSMQR